MPNLTNPTYLLTTLLSHILAIATQAFTHSHFLGSTATLARCSL